MKFRHSLLIALLSLMFLQTFSQRLIPYRKGTRWGYADSNGVIKIKPQFDYAGTDACGLMSVTLGLKTGIIDRDGKVVVPLEYRSAGANCGDWNGGSIIIREGETYTLLSHDGKKVLATGIHWIISHSGPNIEVEVDRKHGLINNSGKWLLEPEEDWIEVSDGGYYAVKRGEETQYYNPSGKLIFKKKLLMHSTFENGYARIYYKVKKKGAARRNAYKKAYAAEDEGYSGDQPAEPKMRELTLEEKLYFQQVNVINHKGKLLLREGYTTNMAGPRNGWMTVRGPKGMGIVDSTGKFVVPAIYDEIDGSMGFVLLKKNNLFGAVTPGSWRVVKPTYTAIEKFNGSLYVARSGEWHKLIDPYGKQLYGDFKWISMAGRSGITAGRENKIYWMDKKGTILLEMDTLRYQSAYPFDGELSVVHRRGKAGLINRQGKEIAVPVFSAFYKEGDALYRVHGSAVANTFHSAGIMNQDGKLLLDTVHQMVHVSRDQKHIVVQDNDLWGLYDVNGKEILPKIYIQLFETPTGVYVLEKPNPDYKPVASGITEGGTVSYKEPATTPAAPLLYYIADKEGKILGSLREFPGIENTFSFLQDANGWIRFDGKKFWEE